MKGGCPPKPPRLLPPTPPGLTGAGHGCVVSAPRPPGLRDHASGAVFWRHFRRDGENFRPLLVKHYRIFRRACSTATPKMAAAPW